MSSLSSDFQIEPISAPLGDSGYLAPFKAANDFGDVPVLEANIIASVGDTVDTKFTGSFYIPAAQPGTPCEDVYRQAGLANPQNAYNISTGLATNQTMLAVAPWAADACSLAALNNSINAGGMQRVVGMIFWMVGQTGAPPDPSSSMWNVSGSNAWQGTTSIPIFAIPGDIGDRIYTSLDGYAANLSAWYDPGFRPWIRGLITPIQPMENHLPSIWYFLLIILCVLLGGVAFVSGTMHFIQRRHRRNLQRRLERGEVNVESLGIRRLRVPPDILAKLPLYTYTSPTARAPTTTPSKSFFSKSTPAPAPAPIPEPIPVPTPIPTTDKDVDGIQPSAPSTQEPPTTHDTCAICLDDYTPHATTVRELPCHHIFHPDCIDPFLRENSNLCPLCKASVLAHFGSYTPQVTNAMVRRERIARNRRLAAIRAAGMRESLGADEAAPAHVPAPAPEPVQASGFAARLPRPLQSVFARSHQANDLEMTANSPQAPTSPQTTTLPTQPTTPAPPPGPSRREWARQRAVRMLGPAHAPEAEDEVERAARRSGWRRAVGRVFPSSAPA